MAVTHPPGRGCICGQRSCTFIHLFVACSSSGHFPEACRPCAVPRLRVAGRPLPARGARGDLTLGADHLRLLSACLAREQQ